ncbi:hypothetical protein A7P95_10305 [Eikenella longinqua]|uniref:Uncharacterized protein n=1 Tax=Eikenella longinqua TaxID=1795827 RepID=A0A1A9RVU1_9NEIS|nr:hypothetical protein A7P95_10305 [Eikenella longinqua]
MKLIEICLDEDNEIIEFHFSLASINNMELGLIQDMIDAYIDRSTFTGNVMMHFLNKEITKAILKAICRKE